MILIVDCVHIFQYVVRIDYDIFLTIFIAFDVLIFIFPI